MFLSGNGVIVLGQQSGSCTIGGLAACHSRCSQQSRKRGRPRKEKASKQVYMCHAPDHMHTVAQPMTPDMMEELPTHNSDPSKQSIKGKKTGNNVTAKYAEATNSYDSTQTVIDQLALHDSEVIPAVHDHVATDVTPNDCHEPKTRKRERCRDQDSRRCMHRPNSDTHVHTIGEPSTPHATETTARSVHANGEPSVIENVGHRSQGQKRNRRTGQASRRSVRQRFLTGSSQRDSDNRAHNIDQASSSYTTQGVSLAYDDLGDCTERCQYCNVAFWRGEWLIGHRFRNGVPQYHLYSNGPDLDPEVVQGLIHFLDTHNELVQIFKTARNKCDEHDVLEFKVRLYSGEGPHGYELPASQTLGAIVFDSGPESESNYDVILEYRDGVLKRISKIHKSYMSLQFPLIFIYGQSGYHTKLMVRTADPNDEPKRVSMNAFYTYQLHPRHDSYNLLF
ncbi:DNA helicase Pif1-like protein [Artemisia annua]|uniref:DNA helicase Pif1-like protein n=1 Tax=Artemisia annua TaxID=35608 RepID=A0A2U1NN89_ARTAN|nr:DNA helicase Pif1-like protein [Artemisia annua]